MAICHRIQIAVRRTKRTTAIHFSLVAFLLAIAAWPAPIVAQRTLSPWTPPASILPTWPNRWRNSAP